MPVGSCRRKLAWGSWSCLTSNQWSWWNVFKTTTAPNEYHDLDEDKVWVLNGMLTSSDSRGGKILADFSLKYQTVHSNNFPSLPISWFIAILYLHIVVRRISVLRAPCLFPVNAIANIFILQSVTSLFTVSLVHIVHSIYCFFYI